MSAVKGKMITCSRDDNFVFLKYLGTGETDGGHTVWDKFEDLPDDWLYEPYFGYLCPKCAKEFKELVNKFFNGNVAPCWKLSEEELQKLLNVDEIAIIEAPLLSIDQPKRPIYQSFCSRDCETFYICPTCNETFGDWSIKRDDPRCPHCKQKLEFRGGR